MVPGLVSVFTASHGYGAELPRALDSLLAQSHDNWEWVIADDRADHAPGELETIPNRPGTGGRVRVVEGARIHSVGAAKAKATAACRGEILVELDHDDELSPRALEHVVKGFASDERIGFVHSDWIDVVDGAAARGAVLPLYGSDWAFGLGSYCYEKAGDGKVPVAQLAGVGWDGVRHISSMPNHLRAWRSETYRSLGGHDPAMCVADDYELLVRTFLGTMMARIPLPLYVQHHRADTASRTYNEEIQTRVAAVADRHESGLDRRCLELGAIPCAADPLTNAEPIPDAARLLCCPPGTAPRVSVIVPTFDRPDSLRRALESVLTQSYEDFEVIVAGDSCPAAAGVADELGDSRVRYLNLGRRHADGGAGPRNYALKTSMRGSLVAYLDDDNRWSADHLETLIDAIEGANAGWAFASLRVGREDFEARQPRRYSIDTSAIIHHRQLLDRYGYWKPNAACDGAHDWELVSRWRKERWAATGRATVEYTMDSDRHPPGLLRKMREARG